MSIYMASVKQKQKQKRLVQKAKRQILINRGVIDHEGRVLCQKTRDFLGWKPDPVPVVAPSFDDDITEVIKPELHYNPTSEQLDRVLTRYPDINKRFKAEPHKLNRLCEYIKDSNSYDGLKPTTREIEENSTPSELHHSRFFLVQNLARKSSYDLSMLDCLNKHIIIDVTHSDYGKHREELQKLVNELLEIKAQTHVKAVIDNFCINDREKLKEFGSKIKSLFVLNFNYEIIIDKIESYEKESKGLVAIHEMYTERFELSKLEDDKLRDQLIASTYNPEDIEEILEKLGINEESPEYASRDNYENISAGIFLAQKTNDHVKVQELQMAYLAKEKMNRKKEERAKIKPISQLSFREGMDN